MIAPVLTIVGKSDAGKTTVASYLIETLTQEGYRIAAVKHCPHGHEIDHPESDTGRLRGAGAVTVVASSPSKVTTVETVGRDITLESIVSTMAPGIDLVIAEGYKDSAFPKVLVADGEGPHPVVENVVAVVTRDTVEREVPTYHPDNLRQLADKVRGDLLDERPAASSVSLTVDGVYVPLKRYPALALAEIVKGFLASLDDIPRDPAETRITISTGATRQNRR